MTKTKSKIGKCKFRLGDVIKMKDGYWICVVKDKELSCFALTNKNKLKVNYRKLFITSTDFKFGNLKFEFV